MNEIKIYNEILVHPLEDGKSWEMKDWFAVYIKDYGLIYIPKTFVTDFGSIPRFLWFVLGSPATGKHRRATVIHDWLYSSQQISRHLSDKILNIIMEHDRVPNWKRRLIFAGVYTFGFFAWNNKTLDILESNLKLQQESYYENSAIGVHRIFA